MSRTPADGAADAEVLVIGGGITGVAVARDAAARGLSVTLVEARDLAFGTSSRSTKLLHGGLRYLEQGRLRLVREALREREITARLAPGLARPLSFCVPTRAASARLWVRTGVAMYDLLAGRHDVGRGRTIDASDLRAAAPALDDSWTAGVAFMDRQTDDARLTVAIARDAARRGAEIKLGLRVVGLRRDDAGHTVACRDESGAESTIRAACVVNAAGPWIDAVRALGRAAEPLLHASRGAHLVLDGLPLGAALLLPGMRRGHRIFAIPWRGVALFGTTDVPDAGDPGREAPAAEDVRTLFDAARALFPGAGLTRRSVLSSFTGVRPLLRQDGDTLAASREHRVLDEDGLITIAGGKLTTWRTMAIATVDAVARQLGRTMPSPAVLLEEPLPGGAETNARLEAVVADEMVRHADDVVFRRLDIGHDPRLVKQHLPSVIAAMGSRFSWDEARRRSETARVLARVEADERNLDAALGGS